MNCVCSRPVQKVVHHCGKNHKTSCETMFRIPNEFDGSSYAVYQGLRTDTPRLKGDSGMLLTLYGGIYYLKGAALSQPIIV